MNQAANRGCDILIRVRRGPTPTRRSSLAALLIGGLVLAACSSSSPGQAGTTTTSAGHSSTTSTTSGGGPTTTTSTLPAFPSSGPLSIGSPIPIPLTTFQVLAAEAPDGTVFVAAQAPVSPAPSVIYVVDGNGPATVAEHFGSGVAALAADATNLYVATYSTVTAFSRSSGNQVAQWTLPAVNSANSSNDDLVAMTAAAGRVDVLITQGNDVSVLRITPTSSAAPVVVVQGIGGAAVGPDGTIYYEQNSQRLTSVSPSGTTVTGPALTDSPNGEGGGVQEVNFVAGGEVWVGEPAGQGEDTQWTTFDVTTLAQAGQFSGTLSDLFVNTSGGALIAAPPSSQNPCTNQSPGFTDWCVSRVSPQGAQSASQSGNSVLAMVGLDPVIIGTAGGSNQVQMWRVG
jgi:hypothetical protein